jgi:uncharacterized protein (TIGR03437 family)
VTVTGTNWNSDSLIYFDGLAASVASLDAADGVAVVTPPAGANSQVAVMTVYNSDGQNSQLVQSGSPVTYDYGVSATPVIVAISPSSLPAGSESIVDINTSGFAFQAGQVAVGFGTTDVVVRRVFVLGPNRLQVDVSVAGDAALSNPDVSVVSGFRIATSSAGFQITPAVPGQPNAIPVLTNDVSGLNGAYAGATVTLSGNNLLGGPNAIPSLSIGGQSAAILSASSSQIVLQIPAGLAAGPATVALNNGSLNAFPVVIDIDSQPAAIAAVLDLAGITIDKGHPAHQGDLILLNVNGLMPASPVQISVGGVLRNVLQVTQLAPGTYQAAFLLNTAETVGAAQQVIVYADGRSSYPATMPIARQDGTFTLIEEARRN